MGGGKVRLEEKLGHPDDAIQRCADFMAHRRQKIRFGPVSDVGGGRELPGLDGRRFQFPRSFRHPIFEPVPGLAQRGMVLLNLLLM
jgi:hypothetical protein